MRVQIVLSLTSMLLVVGGAGGCAGHHWRGRVVEVSGGWVGQTEDVLLTAWGPPARQRREPNGNRVLEFTFGKKSELEYLPWPGYIPCCLLPWIWWDGNLLASPTTDITPSGHWQTQWVEVARVVGRFEIDSEGKVVESWIDPGYMNRAPVPGSVYRPFSVVERIEQRR